MKPGVSRHSSAILPTVCSMVVRSAASVSPEAMSSTRRMTFGGLKKWVIPKRSRRETGTPSASLASGRVEVFELRMAEGLRCGSMAA